MAKSQWHKTKKYPGVRYRIHPTRKHGVHPDKYYTVTYKLDGKTITEAAGWGSEGVKPSEVYDDLNEIKKNRKRGNGPVTLSEKRKLDELERKREANNNITLDQYWPIYLESRKQEKGFKSWDKELSHYTHWLSPHLGNKVLKEIDADSFDIVKSALSKKSARSVEYITGTLRRILKHALIRKFVSTPPPSPKKVGVKSPGESNRRTREISVKEKNEILSTLVQVDENGWRLTRFLFLTGCRPGEAFKLKWGAVNYGKNELTFMHTKTADNRTIPLSDPIKELLAEIPRGDHGDNVFLRPNGKPYLEAPRSFINVVNTLGFNDGREQNDKITFYSIRHTVATHLINHMNLKDFKDTMGWKSLAMAMRYVKPNKEAQKSALDSLVL